MGRVEGNWQNESVKGSGGPTRPTPVCYELSVWRVSNIQPSLPRGREKKDSAKMNFSSCSNHSWIKNDCYIFSLTFEFEYFFFCWLLSLQHNTLGLWSRPSSLERLSGGIFHTPSNRISHHIYIARKSLCQLPAKSGLVCLLNELLYWPCGLKFVYPTINFTLLRIIVKVKLPTNL